MIWPEGHIYVGDWKDNYRWGRGTMELADGTSYEGGWAQDREFGHGTVKYLDGTILTDFYINGRRSTDSVYRV